MSVTQRGEIIARLLARSWEAGPGPVGISGDELEAIAPVLLGTGAGALAWWRIREADLADSPAAGELHQAFRLHSLQALVQQQKMEQALRLFAGAGIQVLLVKGWSVAGLYPWSGLRPYGDLDLCVPPADFEAAKALLSREGDPRWNIDLHEGIADLHDRSCGQVWGKARIMEVNGITVRLLSLEDQLRHLCLHLLRHGGWRPLWLCDLGAALTAAQKGFDWDYFFWGNSRWTQWALAAVGLAQELLQAPVVAELTRKSAGVPRWMVSTVLREWSRERIGDSHTRDDLPFRTCLRTPGRLLQALGRRWPNAIEAGMKTGQSPHGLLIGLPSACQSFLARACKFVVRLARQRQQPGAQAGRFVIHQE